MAKDMSKRKAVAKHLYMKRTSIHSKLVNIISSLSRLVSQCPFVIFRKHGNKERAACVMSKKSVMYIQDDPSKLKKPI